MLDKADTILSALCTAMSELDQSQAPPPGPAGPSRPFRAPTQAMPLSQTHPLWDSLSTSRAVWQDVTVRPRSHPRPRPRPRPRAPARARTRPMHAPDLCTHPTMHRRINRLLFFFVPLAGPRTSLPTVRVRPIALPSPPVRLRHVLRPPRRPGAQAAASASPAPPASSVMAECATACSTGHAPAGSTTATRATRCRAASGRRTSRLAPASV